MLKNKIKTLDRIFSRYIRLRDTGEGYGRCITCGAPITAETCDAGHYISRYYTATRWHECNVHAQCLKCNRYNDGEGRIYRQILIKRYGLPTVEELERKKHMVVHLDEQTLDALIKHYQNKMELI